MSTVTLSSKYQIVIPREIREMLKLKPGQKLSFFTVNGQLRIIPIKPIGEYRGSCSGLTTTGFREKKDRSL